MVVPTEQLLGENSIDRLRSMLVERGGSWSKAETKADLVNRILELDIAVQANEKVKNATSISKAQLKPEPVLQAVMTTEEAKKAVKPWIDRGVTIKFSPDKKLWLLEFSNGKITRSDSGNMAIPPSVLTRCAEMLVRPKAGDRLDPAPQQKAIAAYAEE